ncbi:MAG: hypothetical protein KFKLKKLM_00355 [Flavobacteriales bacterium]|nr:hypothetical protein [Flavobacteriales bacterium]
MKKIVFLIFITISSIAYAQNIVHVIKLNPDSALKNRRFSCLEVMDARINKENIGSAIGNANAIAQLAGDFVSHLTTTINKMLPQDEGKPRLIIIVRNLSISEKTESTEKLAFCKVEIEFAKKVDSTLYSLGVFDANIIGKGNDVTNFHDKRILLGLEECFKKLDETNWENAKEFIIEDIHHKLMYDFRKIPPKGVYSNYEQLIRGNMLDTTGLKIKPISDLKNNTDYNIKINKIDNPKNVQFVSDGENIYIRANRYYFKKSTIVGKYIYFRGKFQPTINTETDLTTGAAYVAAGIVTGILTGIVLLPAGNSNAPINGLVLDTETGELKGLTDYYITNITKSYPEIFKEYRASKRNLEAKEMVIKKLNSKFN